MDSSACAGFKVAACSFIAGGGGFPDAWYLDIQHDSGQKVFQVEDRKWNRSSRLQVTLGR